MAQAAQSLHDEQLWLETRRFRPLIKQPWQGIINLLVSFAFFMLLWWVFMDPRGVLRWYTPQYGYMYIRWMLIVAIWQAYVMNFWPFKRQFMEDSHPLVKGLVLIGVNFAVVGVLIWGFYYSMMGRFAIPYFSPFALEDKGMTFFFGREYSSLAILMMAAIASWMSPIWPAFFDNHPWHGLKQPARGITVWVVTFFLTTYLYFFLMHPHYGILFYPWQEYTAAYPWWYNFAHTLSGNFSVGWVMCCTAAVWLFEVTMDRYPFRLIKTQPKRGIAAFFGIMAFGILMFITFNLLQDISWGPAVEGAKRDFAPDWRYLHSGELGCMTLLPALTLGFYFDNWPRKFSPAVNIAVRWIIIIIGLAVFHVLYYKFSPGLLGTQAGYSHPQQFPMAPVILWINVMLYHNWFMDLFPGKRLAPREAAAASGHEAKASV